MSPGSAEALQTHQPETISRRTDDILFNVRYLASNIVDRERAVFDSEALSDVLEQNKTDLAESDIHALAPIVYQRWDAERGQYISLGSGTVDNNINGLTSLDTSDSRALFEFYRRTEEVTDEVAILEPAINERLRAGAVKVFISPSPTHYEADPDVAVSFDYDDRTLLRLQRLSPDGQTKSMQSFTLFNVTAKAWADFLGARYGEPVEPTAQAVMEFCNRVILTEGSTTEILQDWLGGVMEHTDAEDRLRLEAQLDAFQNEQEMLDVQADYYANEKLKTQKELALSLGGPARPHVDQIVRNMRRYLNPGEKYQLHQRYLEGVLQVDDYVAELVTKIKTVTLHNRAGLATMNHQTMLRYASRAGLEEAIEMAQRELIIQESSRAGNELLSLRNERNIAETGVGCGGGCSVSVADLFGENARIAKEAGLSGELYESAELNANSRCKCGPKAHVISNGKDVVCTNCREYQVNGERGQLKLPGKKAT